MFVHLYASIMHNMCTYISTFTVYNFPAGIQLLWSISMYSSGSVQKVDLIFVWQYYAPPCHPSYCLIKWPSTIASQDNRVQSIAMQLRIGTLICRWFGFDSFKSHRKAKLKKWPVKFLGHLVHFIMFYACVFLWTLRHLLGDIKRFMSGSFYVRQCDRERERVSEQKCPVKHHSQGWHFPHAPAPCSLLLVLRGSAAELPRL